MMKFTSLLILSILGFSVAYATATVREREREREQEQEHEQSLASFRQDVEASNLVNIEQTKNHESISTSSHPFSIFKTSHLYRKLESRTERSKLRNSNYLPKKDSGMEECELPSATTSANSSLMKQQLIKSKDSVNKMDDGHLRHHYHRSDCSSPKDACVPQNQLMGGINTFIEREIGSYATTGYCVPISDLEEMDQQQYYHNLYKHEISGIEDHLDKYDVDNDYHANNFMNVSPINKDESNEEEEAVDSYYHDHPQQDELNEEQEEQEEEQEEAIDSYYHHHPQRGYDDATTGHDDYHTNNLVDAEYYESLYDDHRNLIGSSSVPSDAPSSDPSNSKGPSVVPSSVPSLLPSSVPSDAPTSDPSKAPSKGPSAVPSSVPSLLPSSVPSDAPTSVPSSTPSQVPSNAESSKPSDNPSEAPNFSTVGGGENNQATGEKSTISGGSNNVADGDGAVVSGGSVNRAKKRYSTISGGLSNKALGIFSTVTGGRLNLASGLYSTINGGLKNKAKGDYSIAMGRKANAVTDHSFVINLTKGRSVSSKIVGQFLVKCDAFTVRIGRKEATINSGNIGTFKDLLGNGRRMLEKSDSMVSVVKELQDENKIQQGLINKMQEQIIKQEENIEKMTSMLRTLLDTNNNSNNTK
jgi:hypothetical protein